MSNFKLPKAGTIEDVCAFLKLQPEQLIKTLIYTAGDDRVVALVRGDHEANLEKLTRLMDGARIEMAEEADVILYGVVPLSQLTHDITESNKVDGFKGRAFRKGHIIRVEDIPRLKNLGKENIYVLELSPDDIHENDAAELLAVMSGEAAPDLSGASLAGKRFMVLELDNVLKL